MADKVLRNEANMNKLNNRAKMDESEIKPVPAHTHNR